VREGEEALELLRQMLDLAEAHGIPTKGLKFQLATFEILAAARRYFFQPYSEETAQELQRLKANYKRRFNRNYSIMLNFDRAPVRKLHLRWILPLMFRDRSRYRLLDQLVTLRALAWAYPVVSRMSKRIAPKFARKQAMGSDLLFK
jgi:hypothetical protein